MNTGAVLWMLGVAALFATGHWITAIVVTFFGVVAIITS